MAAKGLLYIKLSILVKKMKLFGVKVRALSFVRLRLIL